MVWRQGVNMNLCVSDNNDNFASTNTQKVFGDDSRRRERMATGPFEGCVGWTDEHVPLWSVN